MRAVVVRLLGLALGAALFLAVAGEVRAAESPGRKPHTSHAPADSAAAPLPGAGKEPTGRGRGHHTLRGTVNINQADEATLELLPGVGEATAGKIVSWRKQRPFKRVEDITRVKGIGKKKLARMRPFLSVSGPSTLVEEDAQPAEAAE